jgi:hypothetical protein
MLWTFRGETDGQNMEAESTTKTIFDSEDTFSAWPRRPSQSNRSENSQQQSKFLQAKTKCVVMRIIDWLRALNWVFGLLFGAFLLSLPPVRQEAPVFMTTLAVCFLAVALWEAFIHFRGSYFDTDQNRLSFPTLLVRRSIPLSEISDANAEFIVKQMWIPPSAYSKGGTKSHRIYAVNLSGDFGARQIKFWSRKRRDQFLSILRKVCPDCRITRWSSGYGEY